MSAVPSQTETQTTTPDPALHAGGGHGPAPRGLSPLDPTGHEQHLLELLNEERMERGLQPLALDERLDRSADAHSAWLLATGEFSHRGEDGSSSAERMRDAGVTFPGGGGTGENVGWLGLQGAHALRAGVEWLHNAWMASPTHRENLLDPSFSKIGLGLVAGDYARFPGGTSLIGTQNFSYANADAAQLTGVVTDDADGDGRYDPGEGLAGWLVTATGAGGEAHETYTNASGGYALALGEGEYEVVLSPRGAAFASATLSVSVERENVKLDHAAETTSLQPEPAPPEDAPEQAPNDPHDQPTEEPLPPSGPDTLPIRLALAAEGAQPAGLIVSLNGVDIARVEVANTLGESGFWAYVVDAPAEMLVDGYALELRCADPEAGTTVHVDAVTIDGLRTEPGGGTHVSLAGDESLGLGRNAGSRRADSSGPDEPVILSLAAHVGGGPAEARLLIDGREMARITVENTTWREGVVDYVIDLPQHLVAGDGHRIELQFTNPHPGRGLIVEAVTVMGTRYEASDPDGGPWLTAFGPSTLFTVVTGSNGLNVRAGGAADDRIAGTDAADWIDGGAGDDILSGGAGDDVFLFDLDPGARDTITDFAAGSDRVALRGPEFGFVEGADVAGGSLVTLGRWGQSQGVLFEGVGWDALSSDFAT